MKLFARYNRLNTTATITIFLVGSAVFFFVFRFILIDQVDESLKTEQREIVAYVQLHHQLPNPISTKDQSISFEPIAAEQPALYKTIARFKKNKKHGESRQHTFSIEVNGNWYLGNVTEPLEQTRHLLRMIVAITLCMIGLILGFVFWINRKMLQNLWQPFYRTLDVVGDYSLSGQQQLQLPETNIDEFLLLHGSLRQMTGKAAQDYQSLKEFTALAAHEMQTPLSVIRNKTDALLQHEDLQINHIRELADVEKATDKLVRLHRSLLLLTKVENHQFPTNETINLDALINEKIKELSEVIEAGAIVVTTKLEPVVLVSSMHLLEILVGNLLNNAIRYNIKNGSIKIDLHKDSLQITNTSYLPALANQQLYQHFYRHPDTKMDGNGLGLSIVKRICDTIGFRILYGYEQDNHSFTIWFS